MTEENKKQNNIVFLAETNFRNQQKKFGIKKETDTAQGIGDYDWWNCHHKFEINHDIGGWFIIELGNHRFNYVHELQNIFHALTGSELHTGGEGIKT